MAFPGRVPFIGGTLMFTQGRLGTVAVLLLLAGCASIPVSGSDDGGEWRSMFDGQSLAGWHGYHASTTPPNWRVQDGAITVVRDRNFNRGGPTIRRGYGAIADLASAA